MTDIDVVELAERLGDVRLIDVRTPREYDGSLGHSCDPRQGHIPGAVNIDVSRLLQLEAAEIAAELGVPAGAEVVAYCHSGSRSAVATALLRTVGYDARNYVGSWHEWSRRDDLPLAT